MVYLGVGVSNLKYKMLKIYAKLGKNTTQNKQKTYSLYENVKRDDNGVTKVHLVSVDLHQVFHHYHQHTCFMLAVQIECHLSFSGTVTVILQCTVFQLHVAEW